MSSTGTTTCRSNVLFAGGCTTLGAYVPSTGAQFWSIATSGEVHGITAANGLVYACIGMYGVGVLSAYSATDGALIWSGGGDCNSAPVVVNGIVYSAYAELTAYAPFEPSGTTNAAMKMSAVPRPEISQLVPDRRLTAQRTPEIPPQ